MPFLLCQKICTVNDVGLYFNTLHEDELVAMRKTLDVREDNTASTLIKLAECILKKNIFEYKLLSTNNEGRLP